MFSKKDLELMLCHPVHQPSPYPASRSKFQHSHYSLTFHLFPFSVSPWCWILVTVPCDMTDRKTNEKKKERQELLALLEGYQVQGR